MSDQSIKRSVESYFKRKVIKSNNSVGKRSGQTATAKIQIRKFYKGKVRAYRP